MVSDNIYTNSIGDNVLPEIPYSSLRQHLLQRRNYYRHTFPVIIRRNLRAGIWNGSWGAFASGRSTAAGTFPWF